MINTGATALQVGAVDGLLLSYASTTTVTIGIGAARDADNTDDIDITSQKTVDISTTGANALDTGTATSNTWYYVYVIKNPSTNTTAGLFSASSSSPTMPSGYTKKRRIGSVRYTPSGIAQFVCMGQGRTRHVEWMGDISNLQALTSGSVTTFTDVSLASYVPTISTLANLMIITTVSGIQLLIRPNGGTQNSVRQTTVGLNHGASVWLQTDASQVIEYKNSDTGGASHIYVLGYLEEL